jgi:hypothetical protein
MNGTFSWTATWTNSGNSNYTPSEALESWITTIQSAIVIAQVPAVSPASINMSQNTTVTAACNCTGTCNGVVITLQVSGLDIGTVPGTIFANVTSYSLGTITSLTTRAWEVNATLPGTYPLRTKCTSSNGDDTSGGIDLEVNDTEAPQISITSPAPNAYVRGTTISIAGTASDYTNSSGFISTNSTIFPTNSGTYGSWIFTNTSALTDGYYAVLVTANDSQNNTNSAVATFTVDNTGPQIDYFNVTPTALNLNDYVIISWNTSDTNFRSVNITIDSTTITNTTTANGTFNYTPTTAGALTIRLEVWDLAGNINYTTIVINVAGPPSPPTPGGGDYTGGGGMILPTENVTPTQNVTVSTCNCQSPGDWSACIENSQSRTSYDCSAATEYKCTLRIETRSCQINMTFDLGMLSATINQLEEQIAKLKEQGADTTELENELAKDKDLLQQIQSDIEAGRAEAAETDIEKLKELLTTLNNKVKEITVSWLPAVLAIVGAVFFFIALLYRRRKRQMLAEQRRRESIKAKIRPKIRMSLSKRGRC